MSLMSVSQLQKYSDKLAVMFEQMALFSTSPGIGQTVTATTSATAGTQLNLLKNLEAQIANAGDHEIEVDLGANIRTYLLKAWARWTLNDARQVLNGLNDHCASRGSSVSNSIVDLTSFLAYYNGGSGGAKFSALLHPSFAELFNFVMTPSALSVLGTFSPGLSPNLPRVGTGAANGMGTKTVAGVFTDGSAVNTTYYQGVNLLAEVTVDFTGGAAPPTVTVTGTDDLANAAQTWTGTLSGNNPTAAGSTTVTGALTAHSYGSVLIGSSTGMAVGTVLVLDAGLVTQESTIVEAIADGTHATFANRVAHGAGAAVTFNKGIALTVTGTGRRCVDVTAIAIGISSHSAGTIRICGVQDRMGNPAI